MTQLGAPEKAHACLGEGAYQEGRCHGALPCVNQGEAASLAVHQAGQVAYRQVAVACCQGHLGVAEVRLARVVQAGHVAHPDLQEVIVGRESSALPPVETASLGEAWDHCHQKRPGAEVYHLAGEAAPPTAIVVAETWRAI